MHNESAVLVMTSGDLSTFITHAIHLNTPIGKNAYSYRFIEIKQPVDQEFPITASAFQNPPTDPVDFQIIGQVKEWLVDIMGHMRARVIEEHLTQLNKAYEE